MEIRERKKKKHRKANLTYFGPVAAFSLSDAVFKRTFRLSKETVKNICHLLYYELQPRTTQKTAMPVEVKVLCALSYFATGGAQRQVGAEHFGISLSQSSISRSVLRVSAALCKLLPNFIKFPEPDEYEDIKESFFDISSFPNIIGIVGCSHIKIIAPPENDPVSMASAYVNPKGHSSLNVLFICDSKKRIRFVNAEHPGISVDWFVWRQCKLYPQLEEELPNTNSWLLGNGNFQPQEWLLTPFIKPESPAEQAYNKQHDQTLNVFRCCIGRLKNRFKCLEGVLRHDPSIAGRLIKACAVLHNMCFDDDGNYEFLDDNELINESECLLDDGIEIYVPVDSNTNEVSECVRSGIVQKYFS